MTPLNTSWHLFNERDGGFLWALSIQYSAIDEQWSPDSSRLLSITDEGSTILETISGKELSFIPASLAKDPAVS